MTKLYLDSDKLRIRVCGGINCAPAGGGKVLEDAFQRELEAYGVMDDVELLRAHCLGECPNGPCVRIAGDRFYHVRKEDVPSLVREEILPRLIK